MSYKYRVNYAFEHLDSDDRPESQKWGFGYVDIFTDKEPNAGEMFTDEESKEIAKTVFRLGEYRKVVIQTVTPVASIDESDEILEGEIIID